MSLDESLAARDGARMRAAAARIRVLAPRFEGHHTPPDQPSGETWDRGQVLSHIAEFLPFWLEQIEAIRAAGGGGLAFGRVKTTPSRLERIEQGRTIGPEEQLRLMDDGVAAVERFLAAASAEELALTGTHPTRGEMTIAAAVEAFIVSHLEEHCAQLAEPDS